MNAKRGVPDVGPAAWALRSSSTWLSQPRGRPAHHGGIRGPQTTALYNSLRPETLTLSLHLPAGPTKTPEASSGILAGGVVAWLQRAGRPKHSHGWGLTQAQEAFIGEPPRQPPAPTPLSAPPPKNTT